ncbi:MAG: DUF177 domain-containing protein [Bacillota bacterium]|nr:DUF177 domain-containing protein [Bacillota bacterium]
MKIDVSELRKVKGRVEEFDALLPNLSLDFQGMVVTFRDLKISGKATNTGREILVQANVEAKAELNCSLCLKPFSLELKFPFVESFFRERDKELKKDDEPLGRIYQGDEIDLSEPINEGLILSLPMKPLCRPDCKGLCSLCGRDFNLEKCNCSEQSTDPRFAVLKELLKEAKNLKTNKSGGLKQNGCTKEKGIKSKEK